MDVSPNYEAMVSHSDPSRAIVAHFYPEVCLTEIEPHAVPSARNARDVL